MEQNKSPFEEIFKKEESRTKEEKKEKGILDALDEEEKSLFEKSSDTETNPLEIMEDKGGGSKEERYKKLLNDLVDKRYFEEAIRLIGEMKTELKQ